jgi:FkbM family methyltransferase
MPSFSDRKYYFGQDGEDVLLRVFCYKGKAYKGFYVDIGAFDPVQASNTQWFYERHWTGINIDANPCSIKLFNKRRKRDINVESGVSDKSGVMEYYYWGEDSSMNTFNKDLYTQWTSEGRKLKEIKKVKVQTINEILDNYLPIGKHINFISLDIEGFEMRILKTFNFNKYAPDYFLIEDLDYSNENTDFMEFASSPLYRFMKAQGYIVVAKTRLTVVFKRTAANPPDVSVEAIKIE